MKLIIEISVCKNLDFFYTNTLLSKYKSCQVASKNFKQISIHITFLLNVIIRFYNKVFCRLLC